MKLTDVLRQRRINEFDTAAKNLSGELWEILSRINPDIKCAAREIRIRISQPIQIYTGDESFFVLKSSQCVNAAEKADKLIDKALLQSAVQSLASYSLHTHQNELTNGFISTVGGGRAGIGACAVYENGAVKSVKDITSVCLRVSKEFHGCADRILEKLSSTSGGMLIAGEPGCGKTTILREVCRKLADGKNGSVVLLDERMEIASLSSGKFVHDVGACCDVLSGYKKSDGIHQAVRTLSPSFVICDEIGAKEDAEALKEFVNTGVRMIASVHAGDTDELFRRESVVQILSTGAFSCVAVLYRKNVRGKMGQVKEFINTENLKLLPGGGYKCSVL